jgi:2-polyprenyl-3-methyl-5-hydroxy-6-metoxy-1,4-benzoquinol methylase
MIKESIIYLIRALNPVAFHRDRAKQVRMLRQIIKHVRIALNPVAFERDRVTQIQAKDKQIQAKDKQIQAKDKQIQAKDKQIQAKDKRIQALQAKVETLLGSKEAAYWEIHYDLGETSGAGSVDKCRAWKWEAITMYLPEIEHVVDVGCGDLSFWEGRDCQDYTGIDISTTVIANNRRLRPRWTFIVSPAEQRIEQLHKDCVFCLDLLFHIMNSNSFRAILNNLCYYSTNYIFIYNWWRNPWASNPRKKDLVTNLDRRVRIPYTDGKYQYFRSLDKYLQVFEHSGFQLIDTLKYTDGVGALYVFKKRV